MRILLLAHSFNSLTQRLWVELAGRGHDLSVELDVHDRVTEEAVALFRPDLIVAPFLKRRIPDTVWRRNRCLVVHPGIRGDRGPSALDWAIMNGETEWGVTVLEANGEMDAGDVWAESRFPMREATKSSLYRNEVTASGSRGAHPGARADRTRGGTGTARLRRPGGARTRASADAPGRSRDRLAGRRYGDRAAQDPRGRRRSRRARRRVRRACVSLRRAPRIVAAVRRGAFPATSSRSATAPSSARRSTAQCGSPTSSVGAASRERSSCLRRGCWGIGSPMSRKSRSHRRRRSRARRGGRSATRSATASAGCTSPSTTARWGPPSANSCAPRSVTRRRARPEPLSSPAGPTTGRTGST